MVDSTFVSAVIIGTVSLVGIAANSWIAWSNQSKEWDRQRQWELKRDTVFDAVRALGELVETFADVFFTFGPGREPLPDPDAHTEAKRNEAKERWSAVRNRFLRIIIVTDLMAGKNLNDLLRKYFDVAGNAAEVIFGGDKSIYVSDNILHELARIYNEAIEAARNELNCKSSQ